MLRKSRVGTAFYEKHIEGGHMTREHKGLSPTRVQSGSEVTTKEGPKRKTRETYYKVQTTKRRDGTSGSGAEIPEPVWRDRGEAGR